MIMDSEGRPVRRGYVRPQGTNFAASAQSRESVLSLGSIAHLQYYFARTGLLDGKGGQLAKDKKDKNRGTLDLSTLDTNFLAPRRSLSCTDKDSSYSSMRSSPDIMGEGDIMESPTSEDYYSDGDDPDMLPPTVSTYRTRSKTIEPPPSLPELKRDLHSALTDAEHLLSDAKAVKVAEAAGLKPEDNPVLQRTPKTPRSPNPLVHTPDSPMSPLSPGGNNQGWYEIQGMHILDIMTLAIRAAKLYYTAHDKPALLSSIKSERKIRAELIGVLDVLKRMATRNFLGGMRNEEREVMEGWVKGVRELLNHEAAIEEEERQKVSSWTWLDDSIWHGKEIEREYAFLKSMDPDADSLPIYTTPAADLPPDQLPTPFLKGLQNGLRLVKLHNHMVKKSKRPFGAIPTEKFHEDTGKPYRMADNLRYWIKAAELRWEVVFEPKVDVMGVVNGDEDSWVDFEKAIWKWCGKVREEIGADLTKG